MKLLAVIRKSTLEQIRQFWILLLTISMAAFFVGIFYLMYQSEELHFTVRVVNQDLKAPESHSTQLISYLQAIENDTLAINFRQSKDLEAAQELIKNRKADAILVIPEGFSDSIQAQLAGGYQRVPFELTGNLTDTEYMLSAIWSHSYLTAFINEITESTEPYHFTETPMGVSGIITSFNLAIPGLLVLSTIMLMLSGAIAFVVEPEKKTMLRLKISKVSPFAFIGGVTVVQLVVGFISIFLTLFVSYLFHFQFAGSFWLFLLVCLLTCLSVIGFSLILAALTKNVNEVLVVGNFPLFLFMFFSGTVFPIVGKTLFSFAGYDVTIPGLMSTYHGVEALKKVTLFNAGFLDIWPELTCLVGLSLIYFLIGFLIYRRRHMVVF